MAKLTLGSLRVHLILVVLASALVIFGTSWALDLYTRHGVVVHIPEVRGKDLSTAQALIEEADLRHEVVDSIYDPTQPGGTVADLVPSAGSAVKPGRIIFVKIYAYEPRKISLPYVKDLSVRQAEALLNSQGFERIELKEVAGEYFGLAVGVEGADGKLIAPGTLLSKSARITLLITGREETTIDVDGLVEQPNEFQIIWDSDSTAQQSNSSNNSSSQTEESSDQEQWW